jgi:hypothetical protein
MILRLIHDENGATHVYDYTQLNLHLERGWKVDPNSPEENAWYLPKPTETPKRGRPFKK